MRFISIDLKPEFNIQIGGGRSKETKSRFVTYAFSTIATSKTSISCD